LASEQLFRNSKRFPVFYGTVIRKICEILTKEKHILLLKENKSGSRDSAVGIVTVYGLDERGVGI
jgi:hypothetical protein